MLSTVSKKLSCLILAGVMLGTVTVEAGSIPTNNVPLYTYAMKKVYCYKTAGGVQKGWIDPGDYVIVTKIQSNGWAYGTYPTPSGRVPRWFKINDLVADRNANYTRYSPTAKTNVYRESSHRNAMGWVNNNEVITVVGGSGNSRQIIYKVDGNGGYKMGWVPYWDCWTASQVAGRKTTQTVTYNNTANVENVVKNRIETLYRNNYNTVDKGNCKEFARDVFNNLFGAYVSTTSNNNMDVIGCENGKKHGAAIDANYSGKYKKGISVSQSYRNKVKSLFKSAKPGYFVQMGQRNKANSNGTAANPHSAIIYYVDNEKVCFYEANWISKTITINNCWTYDKFADTFLGFAIYAPNTYK